MTYAQNHLSDTKRRQAMSNDEVKAFARSCGWRGVESWWEMAIPRFRMMLEFIPEAPEPAKDSMIRTLMAGMLRDDGLAPHHAGALREFLGYPTDDEIDTLILGSRKLTQEPAKRPTPPVYITSTASVFSGANQKEMSDGR